MHFVAVEWTMQPIGLVARSKPFLILPDMIIEFGDLGRRTGTLLKTEAIRISLDHNLSAVAIANLEFIQCTMIKAGNKNLPDAAGTMHAHRVNTAIPLVEITDDTDTLGIRGPHGEAYASNHLTLLTNMCA